MLRALAVASLCLALLVGHADASVLLRGGGYIAPVSPQTIASVSLSNNTFTPGVSASVVGTLSATMSPASPPFSGSFSLSTSATNCTSSNGANNGSFQIVGTTLESTGSVSAGTYPVCVAATQAGISNSPLGQPFTLTAQAFVSTQLSCDPSCAFTAGSASSIGTASASLTPAVPAFSGSWSLQFSGADHASTACDTHSTYFSIIGNTVSATASAVAGTYHVCTVATHSGLGGSPYVQAETVTGSAPALTTFNAGPDVSSDLTITNSGPTSGLTLTSPSGTPLYYGYGARANNAKYSGLWYFEVTQVSNGGSTALAVGLANNGAAQLWPGGWTPNPSGGNTPNFFGADTNETGFTSAANGDGPALLWNNHTVGTAASWAAGKTMGVAVDLNTNSPQLWVTPDVTSLICNGSGGSGSTAPQWNASCTHDPSIQGSGTPVTGGSGA
ncbi:MAG: hypothetical protein JOZ49_18890, partial [Mycolicibacterium sp.]|nr:hypothetical protein [Mycolicibacterium sp.]